MTASSNRSTKPLARRGGPEKFGSLSKKKPQDIKDDIVKIAEIKMIIEELLDKVDVTAATEDLNDRIEQLFKSLALLNADVIKIVYHPWRSHPGYLGGSCGY